MSFLWATGIEDTFITDPWPATGRTLDEYELTQHYERRKSWPELRRIYEHDVLPAWRHRRVKDVTRREIRELVEKKARTAPIMANRPTPELPETLARMLQPQDMGELIVFIARQPPHVCINEVLISPTHNRGYIGQMQARHAQMAGQAT